jgi:hypothetical protein
MNRTLLLSLLFLTTHLLTRGQGMVCNVCRGEDTLFATREGKDNAFYLVMKARDVWGTKGAVTKILVGNKLSRELAMAEYKNRLGIEISKLHSDPEKSPSAVINFIDQFCQQEVSKYFDVPVVEIPTTQVKLKLGGTHYLALIKKGDFFLISLLGQDPPVDILAWNENDNQYEYKGRVLENPEVQNILPQVEFLAKKEAKITIPGLHLKEVSNGNDDPDAEFQLVDNSKSQAVGIALPADIAKRIMGARRTRADHQDDKRVGTYDLKSLRDKDLNQQLSRAENLQQLETRTADAMYIESIRQKINLPCAGCMVADNETLLIYDHKCGKLLYKKAGESTISVLTDINDLKLQYKKPFRIKVVNFNRYLYNLNFATSDIAFTSSESAVMQQYLIPGANNGQISPTNTYTNGGTINSGDYIYSSISQFKANIDLILSKINSFYLPIYTQKQVGKLLSLNNALAANPKISQPIKDSLNSIGKSFNDSLFQLTLNRKIPTDTISMKKRLFLSRYENGISNVFKQMTLKQSISTSTMLSLQTQTKNLLDSVAKSIFRDSVISSKRDSVLKEVWDLRGKFFNLAFYCDSFIDNRVMAYSLCTDSFGCCTSPQQTYRHFDSLVNNISEHIYFLKWAKMIYDSVSSSMQTQAKDTTGQSKVGKGNADSAKATVLAISTSDLKFKNGNIAGISLHLTPDTTKPAKSAALPDPFLAIDSLWFSFERSIPTDYVMRQIIFRNNLISGNMSYTSPPIFPYGDRMGLVLQMPVADSVKRMGTMPSSTVTMSADLTVVGRPLFSFSAGTFFGFGLKSSTYEWQQVPALGSNTVQSNSPYQLVKTGAGTDPIGAAGFANVTWPWPSWLFHSNGLSNNVRIGFSGGVGVVVAPTPITVGYLLGGTISIGTYQQFHFTFGAVGMQANQLKDNLNNNNQYATLPTIQQYNQKIQLGTFLAISYTVFSPKSTGTMQNQVINVN